MSEWSADRIRKIQFLGKMGSVAGVTSSVVSVTASTKCLLSFGSRSGGFDYIVSLREQIMKQMGWTDPSAVYLDARVLGEHEASHTVYRNNGAAYDVRAIKLNPFWQMFYRSAMEHCSTMIYVLTSEWAKSQFCREEFNWWLELAQNEGANAPRLCVLTYSDTEILSNSAFHLFTKSHLGRHRHIEVNKPSNPFVSVDVNPEVIDICHVLGQD
jgi:hypothetical protein